MTAPTPQPPVDAEKPIEIAPRVWWVGHYLPGDPFQCHVYLIEQGESSVLIDPGSVLTFEQTLAKVRQIIPFEHIRYFVCQHQDPDITGALPAIDGMQRHPEATVVTHWRAQVLIRHYGLRMPFWLVDQNEWRLPLEDRELEFVFTPYAHFPGAFCTYDPGNQLLFSSDLFGGFTEGFALFAEGEEYFEAMRPFHEHYIPSRDVLHFALAEIERRPLRMIAPQHGSIIPEHLVAGIIGRLKSIDCGLYLLARGRTDVHQLSSLNRALRDITETMILHRDFHDIANRLLEITQRSLPVRSLEFFAQTDGGTVLHFAPNTSFRGAEANPPPGIARLIGMDFHGWAKGPRSGRGVGEGPCAEYHAGTRNSSLTIPLFRPDTGHINAVVLMELSGVIDLSPELEQILLQLTTSLQVAVEREVIYRALDLERQEIYERSIRDPLSGLFTRVYMRDAVTRLCEIQDREESTQVGVTMMDIDHFKRINDTYGHSQGDEVLRRIGEEVRGATREADIPVRFGGEELIVFSLVRERDQVEQFAERLRGKIAGLRFDGPLQTERVTVSLGTALRRLGEPLENLIQRADMALYDAKRMGRNRVCSAEETLH